MFIYDVLKGKFQNAKITKTKPFEVLNLQLQITVQC